jgi:YidC/Oxa1 family membrane protein insertase
MSYDAWQRQFPGQEAPAAAQAAGEAPEATRDALPALPDVMPEREPGGETSGLPAEPADAGTRDTVRVRSDVLELIIDLRGGELVGARLLDYPLRKDEPDVVVQLLSAGAADRFVVRSGLRAADGRTEPNHQATFTAAQAQFELADGRDELVVPLDWAGANGVSGQKIFRLRRGSYAVEVEQRIANASAEPYRAVGYLQIQRRHNPPERSMFDVDSYSFVGPVLYDGDSYEKLEAEDLREQPVSLQVRSGWMASIQHHFLAAAVPPAGAVGNYTASFDGESTLLSVVDSEFSTVAPGGNASFAATLFVGPKLQAQLAAVHEHLPLTVDYGMLTVLAQPLFWLLQKIYNFVGNWGWTIVIVTFLIKLVFYKLTEKSGRSMAKMRKLAPRLKSIQERYKDDREQLSRAMMDLYKREQVNPAAGCWPMLIQIPFFIAFYWVLLESVEMRQAPFMLWITDLSVRDPFFILPLLMGAAMYFQQKLNPPPPDPTQAKVMQFLPVMFTAMFAFFPAGLVLYWLTNSVLSMAQQWRINKVIGAD